MASSSGYGEGFAGVNLGVRMSSMWSGTGSSRTPSHSTRAPSLVPKRSSSARTPRRPTNQSGGIRGVVTPVRPLDEAVKPLARHARLAGTRLNVIPKCFGRDKRPIASTARARYGARLVQLGVQVLLEVVLILETSVALGAVVVHRVLMPLEVGIAVK